jgi:glycosyltransferase involved in cell wall biosynthesis
MYGGMTESKRGAKSVLILGHITSGMGERSLAWKYKKALEKKGCKVDLIDIIDLMGERYAPFAEINHDLADQGHTLIDDLAPPPELPDSDLLLILSWSFSVAALFATGIHKTRPTAVTLFAQHPQERILPELYRPASLMITESPLAYERAVTYGLDPDKLLFIPHSYPPECETIHPNRDYVTRLAKEQGKTIRKETLVIGCVSRFEYRKNCEYAVEAVRRLFEKGRDLVLVLKGNFPQVVNFPDYQPLFTKMLNAYTQEPWLLWDPQPTPFPKVIEEYASFDLLLHPAGAESGPHVVIECLGLKKPVVLLDCSVNPYLFKGVANFVKTTGILQEGPVPFYVPDLEDLCRVLESPWITPEESVIKRRFHECCLEEKMSLLLQPDAHLLRENYAVDRNHFGV